jgi:hypothetical protein
LTMNHLDNQMKRWSVKLQSDLKISAVSSEKMASTISKEVSELSDSQKKSLTESSVIPIQDRLGELRSFQSWMDFASNVRSNPGVTRAQVITQNYICFVYLSEAWFRELRKTVAAGTTTKQCCKFLTDNPIRAFRNAISHSNWCYKSDFSGIEYWARKGDDPSETMTKFEVSQSDLNFWQSLARCTAYASYLSIVDSVKSKVVN